MPMIVTVQVLSAGLNPTKHYFNCSCFKALIDICVFFEWEILFEKRIRGVREEVYTCGYRL